METEINIDIEIERGMDMVSTEVNTAVDTQRNRCEHVWKVGFCPFHLSGSWVHPLDCEVARGKGL